ncbi:sorting nexin-15 [Protobothrops mucrosquamatus]|uniref:sorting nexin-15 n=2 Tax=Protobothrops mucrosquamatus TaxID=103944 RepID=UPI0007759A74|nr:sorting nexin-15 [Protobothrops mucrosquamatus]
MSRRAKEEFHRSYAVSDPRGHPKGYTEYKVTAKFVSKVNPDDIKEIVVWKRYSDFKKLHADLAYTHRNLFRRMEDFPAFPRAQVFGRFDPEVIEERRKAAEDMLCFTIHIPALNNSPQLKEFFRKAANSETRFSGKAAVASSFQGGEGQSYPRHWESPSLPLPLIPVPAAGVEQGEEALGLVQEDGLLDPKPEVASKDGVSEPQMENQEGASDAVEQEEDLDALFAFREEDEEGAKNASPSHCLLSVQELALFDPFSKEASTATGLSHEDDLASLEASETKPEFLLSTDMTQKPEAGGALYLPEATERIRQAVLCEASRDYQGAFHGYRSGVDLLLQGLHGDPNLARREAVKKKTAEYLQRAEEIFQQHLKHLEL